MKYYAIKRSTVLSDSLGLNLIMNFPLGWYAKHLNLSLTQILSFDYANEWYPMATTIYLIQYDYHSYQHLCDNCYHLMVILYLSQSHLSSIEIHSSCQIILDYQLALSFLEMPFNCHIISDYSMIRFTNASKKFFIGQLQFEDREIKAFIGCSLEQH